MHKERLLTLARFLREKVPDKCWNFGEIMQQGAKHPRAAFESGGGCGTAGCAVGWLPMCFPDDLTWNDDLYLTVSVIGAPKARRSFATAADFLHITMYDALGLFEVSSYPHRSRTTRFEVADRIEQFVKEHSEVKA